MTDFVPLLNPSGKATLRAGYVLVSTEREFLRKATIERHLMVCGQRLCLWAKDFYRGRSIECETLNSHEDDLLMLCHGMDATWAEMLYHKLEHQFASLKRPFEVQELLKVLFHGGPWQALPSLTHATEWLLWLSALPPDDIMQPLLSRQSLEWRRADEQFALLYDADSPQKANDLLRLWLGLELPNHLTESFIFSIDVPTIWVQRASEVWRNRILDRGTLLFEELLSVNLPKRMVSVAAEITGDYLEANHERLTSKSLALIRGYIEPTRFNRLAAFVPPPDPGSPPNKIEAVLRWFSESYLPYRKWNQSYGDSTSQEQGEIYGQQFARWCLNIYPDALAGGEGAKHLAIRQAEKIRESRQDWITLWVVLDGLHYADAKCLAQLIEEDSRLSPASQKVLIATLPTITCFCKDAMIAGLPPDQVASQPSFPTDMTFVSENKDPSEIFAGAVCGDILVWKIGEPDKSYHKSQDRATLVLNVLGELKTCAGRLKAAAKTVNEIFPLRIIISTDHGRLLGSSQREYSVPLGMKPEGRAAHGSLIHVHHPGHASGYEITDEGVVYLNKTQFRLPEDCAIVLGRNAFLEKDGSHGTLEFPHGGLYPEEVLVPWFEFVRDVTLPVIEAQVTGQGVAGTAGLLKIVLKNPGNLTLKLMHLILRFGQSESVIPLEGTIEGMTKRGDITVELLEWPDKAQLATIEGSIWLETLGGKRIETQAQIILESSQLYTSNFDADDLFNL